MIGVLRIVILSWLLAIPAVLIAAGQPRIILQANTHVEVAAWMPRDDFIISAAALTRNVTVWDVRRGVIVDRLALPMPADMANDLFFLDRLTISDDGRTAVLSGQRYGITTEVGLRRQDWQIDLNRRTITAMPSAPTPIIGTAGHAKASDILNEHLAALLQIYEGGSTMTDDEAVAKLPPLPASHDGKWTIERVNSGIELNGPAGQERAITPNPPIIIAAAALAPAGQQIAVVGTDPTVNDVHSLILIDNPVTGGALRTLRRPNGYGGIAWIGDETLLLTHDDSDDTRDPADDGAKQLPVPALLIDAASGKTMVTLPPRCYVTSVGGADGGVIGAGLANCRTVKADTKIWSMDENGKWTDLGAALPKGTLVDAIAGAGVGGQFALALTLPDKSVGVAVYDSDSGDVVGELALGGAQIGAMAFGPDGKTLYVSVNSRLFVWQPGKITPDKKPDYRDFGAGSLKPAYMFGDGKTLSLGGLLDEGINRYDLASGRALPMLRQGNLVGGGSVPGQNIIWGMSANEGLRLWNASTGAELLTRYYFAGDTGAPAKFFTVTPDGRYDTNLGADAAQIRWLMDDQPWQSLAAQTFMRDYYEPQLGQRLADCRAARSCATVFPPPPPLASRNRVLPKVQIESVVPGDTPDTAIITVSAAQGVDPTAGNGKTRSGLYNLRLFRDGHLVAQFPADPADTAAADLEGWRAANRLDPGADGRARQRFSVRLASDAGSAKPEFTAYAFNEDRIKGETARLAYARPPMPPKLQRAYVLAIGEDNYAEPRFKLNYSAADARLINEQLAVIPGREVHRLVLAASGGTAQGNKALIAAALAILGGRDIAAARAALTAAGVDANGFQPATPDDAVVISFSGHGWAVPGSEFYLVPADGKWPDATAAPVRESFISTTELTRWVQAIDAGDMAIILDACHSAGIVDVAGFKPGPMGDRGLGQLAFDKGIRILTATQAENVALEDGSLGHGLLTFALVRDGLMGGKAASGTAALTMGKWLGYGVTRVPTLAAEIASGKRKTRDLEDDGAPVAKARPVQRPALFDFTGRPGVVVRKAAENADR